MNAVCGTVMRDARLLDDYEVVLAAKSLRPFFFAHGARSMLCGCANLFAKGVSFAPGAVT